MSGSLIVGLVEGHGSGVVTFARDGDGTLVSYRYQVAVGGKVASIGGRLLDGAAKAIIGQFFAALARRAGGAKPGLLTRLIALLRGRS